MCTTAYRAVFPGLLQITNICKAAYHNRYPQAGESSTLRLDSSSLLIGGRLSLQIVSQCRKSLCLSDKLEVHKLTIDMRIALATEEGEYINKEFAVHLLDVGEGKIPYDRECGDFHMHIDE